MIHHHKRSILYVDDTMEQRYAMRRILETEGYKVFEAGSGTEALALLGEAPSLAVVDVRLPDINGYELTREIKQRNPYLPVLQVSASFSDPNLRASGLSGGADAYIAQPVHPSELSALVRRMLQTMEAEEWLRFLASIGPKISSSLSLPDTCSNIRAAIMPHFADECMLLLHGVPGQDEPFWSGLADDRRRRDMLEHGEAPRGGLLIDSRFLVEPLRAGDRRLGTIGFWLAEDREYTANDCLLASDLASRAALAIQNCVLLVSEQTARDALIQAEKLATAGRMAAAIAHEVNNPLEALTNLMFLVESAPDATPFVRDLASTALGEITRLAHITHQTLGFYRELRDPSLLDLSRAVEETVELYRARLERNSIRVDVDLAHELTIRGIKGEIRQVIANLLVNAFDAMGSGGVIAVKAEAQNGNAVLTVADNGPGIPPAVLPRIFEPFYSTKQGTGTGLGLWITRNITEKHAGTIEVSSSCAAANHGTTFVLTFPLSVAHSPDEAS